MDHIKALKAKAETALAKQRAILDAAKADKERDLTADEQSAFDAAGAEAEKALAEAERVQKLADIEARAKAIKIADPVKADDPTPDIIKQVAKPEKTGSPATVPATPADKRKAAMEIVGCAAWAAARNKHYPSRTPIEHLELAGLGQIADLCKAERVRRNTERAKAWLGGDVTRSITSLSGGGGDNTIDTPLMTEFIEFLYAASAFMAGGPRPVDLSYGSLDIPGGNASATAAYGAEATDIGYTAMTTRKVSLSAKHLRAITAVTNYLLEISPLSMAAIIGEDLAQAMAVARDAAGLRADGSGSNPTGIRSLTHASNIGAAAAATAPTLAQVDTELKTAILAIENANIPVLRQAWVMAPRIKEHLAFMRDGNGNYAFPQLQTASPTLRGRRVISSTQVPINLGAGTNESELYLIDFGHVLFGEAKGIQLTASTEGSYLDTTLKSAFSRDETIIRATESHDFDMRHTKAAAIRTAVQWGG